MSIRRNEREIKMARYKIYDNKSDVITPVGEKLTAEQWLDRTSGAATPR